MSHTCTVLVVTAALVGTIALYMIRHWQRSSRRKAARLAELHAQVESDLRAIRSATSFVDHLRLDLQIVLSEGPLCASRLDTLGLNERLERLQALLKNQLLGRTGLEVLHERLRCVVRNPYPDDPYSNNGMPYPDKPYPNKGGSGDAMDWQHVRQAISRGASQQAAAHTALESLHQLATELNQRERELTNKADTQLKPLRTWPS